MEGLFFYEIVLMILGVMLFAVLLGLLVLYARRNRSIKPLLLFFLLPVLMIGFPAIGKVKFDQNGLELSKKTEAVLDDPSNETARADLKRLIAGIQPRAAVSSEALVKVALAQAVLGAQENAVRSLDQALERNPKSEAALDLKVRLLALPATNRAPALREAVKANKALIRTVP